MERLKSKLWKRALRSPSQEPMDDQTTTDGRINPEASYLSLIPHVHDISSLSIDSAPVSPVSNSASNHLTEQVELLTEENARLQENIKDLTDQLNTVKETQLTLLSKSEDLSQSLQLEKRRFMWQKNFYEKKILDLALSNGSALNINGVDSGNEQAALATISNSFYQETILELVTQQEIKDGQISQIKSEFEEEIRKLKESHEASIAEIVESNYKQIEELVKNHEELVHNLLSGCEGLFDEMKVEYLQAAENNVELKTKSGRNIWDQFQGLSTEKKGVIVVGVCIVTIASAGWASWGFIIWVWPRLLIFAESIASNPEVLARWLSFLIAFLNSYQFQSFIKSWEEGQPLGVCLKSFLNTDLLSNALQLAPNLFAQFKSKNKSKLSQTAMST